jgi:hypothetical protein
MTVSIGGLLAASIGCAGTLDDPARFLDAPDDDGGRLAADGDVPEIATPSSDSGCPDIGPVLLSDCTGAGCHNSMDKAQGLDLQSPNLAARLIGVPATEGPGLLIDPTTASSSILYAKVTATPPFGARMPLGAKPLDSATIGCVLTWIAQQTTSHSAGGTLDDSGGGAGPGADAASGDGGGLDGN